MNRFRRATRFGWAWCFPLAAVALPAQARADGGPYRNVELASHLDLYDSYSACWSYVHHDGREYAVIGTYSGTSIVRLTDPTNPVEVKFINGPDSDWREMKQYRTWIYVVSEGSGAGRGLQIISMENPDNPRLVRTYRDGFDTAHTVTIDTTRAVLYANGTSIGMVILSLADSENPTQLGVYNPYYMHDLHIRGTRGYGSAIYQGFAHILDLTNPGSPAELASVHTPASFTHNAWTTEDGRYLFVTEENNGGTLKVYDIQNLASIQQVFEFKDLPSHIVHNVHIKADTAFVSYYTGGIRLWDISNPAKPVEFGYYDTFPGADGGFDGVWEIAPYFPSGLSIGSDISTGLYVFRSTAQYGIVRGTVRESLGGPVVPGAKIEVLGTGFHAHAALNGAYDMAIDVAPSVELEASAFGYESATANVAVTLGSDQTIDFILPKLPVGVLSGTVRRGTDNAVLPGAQIEIQNTPLFTSTAVTGTYLLYPIPAGGYTIRCERAGYLPAFAPGVIVEGQQTAVDFTLSPATWYDDVETNSGWTLGAPGDDATTGQWIRAIPVGTSTARTAGAGRLPRRAGSWPGLAPQHPEPGGETKGAPGEVQPAEDHTPDPGAFCFVTGNGTSNTNVGEADVDGGRTTLTSPAYDLSGLSDPRIIFWRWFVNNAGSSPNEDPFITQISNDGGSSWVPIDSLYVSTPDWMRVEIRVLDHFPAPGNVRLRFIAMDIGSGSIVEAAIDDVEYFSGDLLPVGVSPPESPAPVALVVGAPHPTPTSGASEIVFTLGRSGHVRADLYDVRGRLVRTLQNGALPSGTHRLRWDGRTRSGGMASSGVYYVNVRAVGAVEDVKLVLVR